MRTQTPGRVQITLPERGIEGVATRIGPDGALVIESDEGKAARIVEGTLRLLDC